MPTFSLNLTDYLVKHCFISRSNATIMIEDEWDYVEERMLCNDGTVEHLAKELIAIYMAA